MSNPFGAKGRTRNVVESESRLEGFVRTFRAAGATDDEVAAFVAAYDDPTPDWTIAPADLLSMTVHQLRAVLAENRREHFVQTTTPEEQAAAEHEARQAALRGEAARLIEFQGATVRDVIAWAGDDPDRRAAAVAVESGQPRPRQTILDRLS